jgi:hypothetical protein
MFEQYLISKGINPEHFATSQDNPLAKRLTLSSISDSKVDIL